MKRTRFTLVPKKKKTPGAKTKFDPFMCEVARRMCGFLGARNGDLAKVFGVSITTIEKWIQKKPEFAAAVKVGRLEIGTKVAEALVKKAIGFTHPETKTFCYEGRIIKEEVNKYYPPDAGACDKYLKIMFRDIWSEKTEIEITGKLQHTQAAEIPLEDLTEEEKNVLLGINMKQLMTPSQN